ncbi:MAG: hypothetical protein IJJ71_13910 [Treponema sp.]|uniref:ribonuclease III domain-containing protein n=1 Tax=Treponema sp. TaxID=166 RepID=UPI0025FDA30F|nr:ribonuclease III domain-containing protein [Treponema sp.]MBR0497254.1 hypothetical protein [Treponema sp.]
MTTDDVNYILENQKTIEEKISYQFRYHTKLLVQAFTRKSFAQEHDGYEDNEILELYGDQLVNTVMTKWLYDSYSTVPQTYTDDFFYSKKNEAELSKIRANYVNKSALAHCIDMLDLDDYLLLGNSDEKNEVWRNEKVRCDLFEAIIGAIAVDSNWDFKQIEKSCKTMWGMLDFSENYVTTLYDSCDDLGITEPKFSVYQNYSGNNQPFRCTLSLYLQNSWNSKLIEGNGNSEISAKMDAAKKAVDFLQKYKIEQIAQKATPETAVQTLNTLYLKKFISKPELNCSVSPDDDGNQVWRCECFIKEYEDWDGYNQAGIGEEYTKSAAKQSAAYDMICFMLGKENDKSLDNEDYYDLDDD